MKDLTTQKRLAARILKCSKKKIWLDPEQADDIKEAITNIDVKSLIKKKTIKKKNTNYSSRVRARAIKIQKSKGRRKGQGSRKGKKKARSPKKRNWINHIRLQRSLLKELKENNKIENKTYRDLYLKSKGGFFRSKRHLKLYIEEHNLIKNENK